MSTESFRRHTRRRVDAAIHRVCASLPPVLRRELVRFVSIVNARSNLLRALPARGGVCPPLEALRNLACHPAAFTGQPEAWPGATGHPLYVIDSLARHIYGRFPVPRVLAHVWFGSETLGDFARREWYVAHSSGQPFRTLDGLPYAMTRRMERVFLRSRHDLTLEHALRRAEVLGLGGSEELAAAVCATRLGRSLERGAFWRTIVEWFVRHEAELERAQIANIVDHAAETPDIVLGTYAAAVDAAWRHRLQRSYVHLPVTHRLAWPRSRWAELALVVSGVRWRVVELTDSAQLRDEGTAMRHCVASYAARCASGRSSIWSVRRDDVSVLTIEVDPRTAAIVQVRGVRNARGPHGMAGEYARIWAKRGQLGVPDSVLRELAPCCYSDVMFVRRAAAAFAPGLIAPAGGGRAAR